jgi:GMP synthase (glutamine-hydrolysing)
MKLLVVEGNNEETRDMRGSFGILPYHLLFKEMLHFLEPSAIVNSVFPADDREELPTLNELQKYDGVLWTGSSLSVLDDIPSVNNQLNFGEQVFRSGVPFYGSCWGLQIATVVSGGKVGNSKNGLEFGISESVQLTEEGLKSPYFTDRKNNFKSLCIHFDEVVKIPENTNILAYNTHSEVQAMTIDYKRSQFFGVQYHPEFRPQDMSLIASFLAKSLVKKGAFSSLEEVEEISNNLLDQSEIPNEIADYGLHTQEIRSWLDFIKAGIKKK